MTNLDFVEVVSMHEKKRQNCKKELFLIVKTK